MSIRTMTRCMLAMGLVVAVGCSRTPGRLHPPSIDASSAGAKAVEQYDTNHDGKISGAELDKCPALKSAMAQIDTAGEGAITAAMITARIRAWQESKVAQMTVACTVLRNGQPLPGAEVKFVPEKFLGDNIKTATGTTSQTGGATIGVPTTDPKDSPHMAPSLYRVEITKAGDNIPPKYNAETTLGLEVASDAEGIAKGIQFNLRY